MRTDMRISTSLEILRRAINGDTPEAIAAGMHMGKAGVRELLDAAGYPDIPAMTAYRKWRRGGTTNPVLDVAELAEQCAAAVRVNPDWVHAHTAGMGREDLRVLVAVMAALLPQEIDVRERLAWLGSGTNLKAVAS